MQDIIAVKSIPKRSEAKASISSIKSDSESKSDDDKIDSIIDVQPESQSSQSHTSKRTTKGTHEQRFHEIDWKKGKKSKRLTTKLANVNYENELES